MKSIRIIFFSREKIRRFTVKVDGQITIAEQEGNNIFKINFLKIHQTNDLAKVDIILEPINIVTDYEIQYLVENSPTQVRKSENHVGKIIAFQVDFNKDFNKDFNLKNIGGMTIFTPFDTEQLFPIEENMEMGFNGDRAEFKNAKSDIPIEMNSIEYNDIVGSDSNSKKPSKNNAKPKGTLVKVFYCTNRDKNNDNYGVEVSENVSYGFCEISIPKNHSLGELERPPFWWPVENPNKHIMLSKVTEYIKEDFFRYVLQQKNFFVNKSAFIFVHGYNTNFEEAAWRTGQLANDLPFLGMAGFFSWPSNGTTISYLKDIECADESVGVFENFIIDFISNLRIESLHIIGHSMGSRLVTSALSNLTQNEIVQEKIKFIKHIILAAPDLDRKVFEKNILPSFINIGTTRTLYTSDKDKALHLSKTLRMNRSRLGDSLGGVFVQDGIETIDTSFLRKEGNNHSYIFEDTAVINDLFLLIDQNLKPFKRRLREVQIEDKKYYCFRKQK